MAAPRGSASRRRSGPTSRRTVLPVAPQGDVTRAIFPRIAGTKSASKAHQVKSRRPRYRSCAGSPVARRRRRRWPRPRIRWRARNGRFPLASRVPMRAAPAKRGSPPRVAGSTGRAPLPYRAGTRHGAPLRRRQRRRSPTAWSSRARSLGSSGRASHRRCAVDPAHRPKVTVEKCADRPMVQRAEERHCENP